MDLEKHSEINDKRGILISEGNCEMLKLNLVDGYYVHPSAEISESAKIGEGTLIWNQAQVRERVTIGKNCNLGKGVYILNFRTF